MTEPFRLWRSSSIVAPPSTAAMSTSLSNPILSLVYRIARPPYQRGRASEDRGADEPSAGRVRGGLIHIGRRARRNPDVRHIQHRQRRAIVRRPMDLAGLLHEARPRVECLGRARVW